MDGSISASLLTDVVKFLSFVSVLYCVSHIIFDGNVKGFCTLILLLKLHKHADVPAI